MHKSGSEARRLVLGRRAGPIGKGRRRGMRKKLLVVFSACSMAAGTGAVGRAEENGGGIRVGVYDNRAVAVAYAHSKFNPARRKVEELEEARRSGDSARAKELDEWGWRHQRDLHRKGFCRVPVDDILARVRERLPEVARRTGVDVIGWQCDYAAPKVRVIDVTRELVSLFEPSEKTWKTVEGLKDHPAVDLDEMEGHHDR